MSAVGFRPAAGNAGGARAVAQFGSALDWGSSGRRFKSCQPDTGQRVFPGGARPTHRRRVTARRVFLQLSLAQQPSSLRDLLDIDTNNSETSHSVHRSTRAQQSDQDGRRPYIRAGLRGARLAGLRRAADRDLRVMACLWRCTPPQHNPKDRQPCVARRSSWGPRGLRIRLRRCVSRCVRRVTPRRPEFVPF